jgi:predicted protein tyrosine phosphatase
MKLLFLCSQNRMRSPTAEAVFSAVPDIEAASAGTNHDAARTVSADLIEWADVVLVMENVHRAKLKQRFARELQHKKLVVLDIPDEYFYMDPELIRILRQKVPRALGRESF